MVKRKRERELKHTSIYKKLVLQSLVKSTFNEKRRKQILSSPMTNLFLFYYCTGIYIVHCFFGRSKSKINRNELNYFKGMYPTDLCKVFTRWNLNFLCYGYQWSFAKQNTPLLGIRRGRCKFWPTEKPVLSLLGLYYVRFLSDLYKPLNPVFRLAIGDPVKAEKCSNCFDVPTTCT